MEKSPFAGPVTDRLVNETAPRSAEAETIIIPKTLALHRPTQAVAQRSPRLVDLDIERANREALTPEALLRLVWRAQAEHGQQQTGLMTAICNQVASLVERVARNIAREMPEDYRIQVGLARVPWAVMNYRPDDDPGRDFEAYLEQRIKWAILDEVRSHMVAEGVSRRDHEKIDQAIQEAKDAGEDPREYLHELTKGKDGLLVVGGMVGADGTIRSPQTSLEALVYPEDGDGNENNSAIPAAIYDVHEIVSKKEELENIESLLRRAIDFLTPLEKYIYIYYHGHFGINDHSCKVIGDHVGMSEFRVNRILTHASMKVTRLLKGEELIEEDSRFKRQKKREAKEVYLTNIYKEMEKYSNARLLDIEVAQVLRCLPSWQHRHVTKNDRDYNLLVCRVGEQMPDMDLAAYSTERRQVLWVNSSLVIATKELTGSDLRLCIELDRQVVENEPKASQKYILPETPSPFPEKLSQQHRKVIRLLFLSNADIASQLELSKSCVRSHVSGAANILGMGEGYTNISLMIKAMKEGWLDVAGIPVGRTDMLSEKEKEILQDCYDMTYQEAAAAKVLSVSTIRTHWSHIFEEMRVSERRQAVAIAVMDGLVTLDPITTKDLENYHSRLKAENAQQDFADLFTDSQQELIVNLYKPDGVLAYEREVSMVHVNESLHQAARRIGLKGRYAILGLTVFAVEAGLLPMDGVPVGRTAGLGKKERKTLASYYNMTIEEAAQAEGAKKSAIAGCWVRIFKKLDTSDRRQAVLMAIKDGLIESGTEERKSELRAIIERSQKPDLKDYDRFTSQQLAIMRIMDRSNKEIAEALGYADVTVRVEVSKAAQAVGLTGRFGGVSLAILAVEGGILSLDNVVSGRTKKLNKEEKDLLKNHHMQTSSEVAKSKATTNNVVNKIWTNIYDKLETRDRRIAALMAVKDGLIMLPENDSEKRT